MRDGFGLVLRLAQFAQQGLGLAPPLLVLCGRPILRQTVDLGSAALDVLPKRRTFGLERVVFRNQPAQQRGPRRMNGACDVGGVQGGGNPQVGGSVGGIADALNLEQGYGDHGSKENAQNAEAGDQTPANVHAEFRQDHSPGKAAVPDAAGRSQRVIRPGLAQQVSPTRGWRPLSPWSTDH